MLRLRFFASIRERLGISALEHPLDAQGMDVAGLVRVLEAGPLPGCARWLLAENTVIAVNRVVVTRAHALRDGDEIAFYPPVTGG